MAYLITFKPSYDYNGLLTNNAPFGGVKTIQADTVATDSTGRFFVFSLSTATPPLVAYVDNSSVLSVEVVS